MATDRNIVNMVEAIRGGVKQEGAGAGGVDSVCMADVISVEPLTLSMHNTTINKNIYINPALMLEATDEETELPKVFQTSFAPTEIYEFLKEFHEKFVIKKGDSVVVCIAGASFYIAGKAVQV